MLKSAFLAALLLSASAASAQTQPAPAAPAAVVAPSAATAKPVDKNDQDRVVCKQQETIGTRLGGHKVCMTIAQWQQYQRDVQDQVQHLQANIGIVSH